MSHSIQAAHCAPDSAESSLPASLTILFGSAVGVIVTNLFASQTLVGIIGSELHLTPSMNGFISTATLIGYSAGLFLLVPLADMLENRRLVLRMLAIAVAAAVCTALAPGAVSLIIALLVLGAACSAIQILVPVAAAMVSPEHRGKAIGDVMSGLMIGILLSRPIASALADVLGWRTFYWSSALAMFILGSVLAYRLPTRKPQSQQTYPQLIGSLWSLLREEPVLRRRALSASLAMAVFSLFWTAIALRLALPPFALGQAGIALFALAGAGGAVVTPIFGRMGDRGWTMMATLACHILIVLAFGLAAIAGCSDMASPLTLLTLLGLSAVLLDVGVTGDQTLGRREINLLRPEAGSRLNGLFVGQFFLGGAMGSALAGIAWISGGWGLICAIGAVLGICALILDISHVRTGRP
ncbi:putative MFS family arabinose efflux permease [Phyllobacterium myrsinacearum]|uniref:MFS transporter n=1 Tax=Phyllobacterium myrsinacearum TaxID=28101 RepID=UPI001029E6B1|nr:MFS transporter [Phyllobacterium myrsinacearum]RZS79531.1 putative MFS family arabinose efflux permease [Phyllobacterium myrsinacearum]